MPVNQETFDSIAITGHRDYPDRAQLFRGLDQLKAREYYFGGARGIDNDALKYIARTQPGSLRTVVVPNRLIDQPVETRMVIKNNATKIIELKNTGTDRYRIRNQYMVDRSQKTVGFYDFRGKGGTYQTIYYAKSKGKLLKVNPLVKFDEREILSMNSKQQRIWIKQMQRIKVDLPSIKQIILKIINQKLGMTVHDFAEYVGRDDVNTLEEMWLT